MYDCVKCVFSDILECELAGLNECDPRFGRCIDSPPGSYTCYCETGLIVMEDNMCEGTIIMIIIMIVALSTLGAPSQRLCNV